MRDKVKKNFSLFKNERQISSVMFSNNVIFLQKIFNMENHFVYTQIIQQHHYITISELKYKTYKSDLRIIYLVLDYIRILNINIKLSIN